MFWTQLSPATSPEPRSDHAMAYDPVRDVVVLYGGADNVTIFKDTWEWDGVTWAEIVTADSPGDSGDWVGPMTYDEDLGAIVMALVSDTLNLQETWSYDGVNWTKLTTTGLPPQIDFPGFVYYPDINRCVLFGGQTGGCSTDTYLFNGATLTWTHPTPATTPTGTAQMQLVYDPALGKVFKIGGRCTGAFTTNEAYSFDGSNWAHITSAVTLSGRAMFAAAYAPSCETTIIHGGDIEDAGTYSFDGVNDYVSEGLSTNPESRFNFTGNQSMCLNVGGEDVVYFGGQGNTGAEELLNDTWVLSCAIPGVAAYSIRTVFGIDQSES